MSDRFGGDSPETRRTQTTSRIQFCAKSSSKIFTVFVILNLLCCLVCTAATKLEAPKNATSSNSTSSVPAGGSQPTGSDALSSPNEDVAPAPKVLLVSGEEFVDANETPTLLIDNAHNETLEDKTTTTTATVGETTTVAAAAEEEEEEDEAAAVDKSEGDGGGGNVGAAELEEEAPPSFNMPQNISQYMDYIETLFHDLRHQITDLFEPHLPQLIRTSQMVSLSSACSYDMLRLALALRQFESWALRMIDSSGKVPEGIFEGSFTALGSYDQCLGVVFASSSDQSDVNVQTGAATKATRGKYCLVTVSPFLPPKPPADKVERLFQDEANKRNYTKVSCSPPATHPLPFASV